MAAPRRRPLPGPIAVGPWLDAVAEMSRAALRVDAEPELLDLIAGTTARLTGSDFCAVMLVDRARAALRITGSYGLSPEYVAAIDGRAPIPVGPSDAGEGPSSRAFRSQRPSTIVDILEDAPSRSWEALAAREGYRSLLSVPLIVGESCIGVLNCYSAEPHAYTPAEVVLLESISNQAGIAIETARRRADAATKQAAQARRAATLRRRLAEQRRADANHERLLRVVLDGGGLAAVVATTAELLGGPVAVEDPTGHVAALAGLSPSGRAEVETSLRRMADGGADPDSVSVPIRVNEEIAGHLWALGAGRPLAEAERGLLDRAALAAGLALFGERSAQEVEWRLSRDFLDHLLEPDGQTDEVVIGRAQPLGLDLHQPHTVLVARRDRPADSGSGGGREQHALLTHLQRAGRESGRASLVASREDHVVVLWRETDALPTAGQFAESVRRTAPPYGGGGTVSISVGPSCSAIEEYGDAHRLAVAVLDLVQSAGRTDRVVALDSVGAYRLLLQVKRPRELERFAAAILGPVVEHDRRRDGALMTTLRRYLAERCDSRATALALHVHPNTVAYRLRRVEALIGAALTDPPRLLEIQLAMMIYDLLGDDPAPTAR